MKMTLLAVGLLATTVLAQAPSPTGKTATIVELWANAVVDHAPGQVDDSLMFVERLTPEDRARLAKNLPLFRDALALKRTRLSSGAEKRVATLGNDFAKDPGQSRFIDLAIVLHGDAAIVAIQRPDLAPLSSDSTPAPATPGTVPIGQQALERDGDLVGTTHANWNWEFARNLIRWRRSDSDPSFDATWLHATSAFLMSVRQYGDARNQLDAAIEFAPKDAPLLFDRACYFEMQGLPESQALLTPEDLMAIRVQRGTNMRGNLMTKSDAAKRTGLRPAPMENADAERLFRSALEIDPGFLEARVRLARLLAERGRHSDAEIQLASALASPAQPDNAVTFLAHLFSGREDRVLGRLDSAEAHFRSALALYPDAPSALLGLSQIAVLRADVAGALDPIRRLEASASSRDRSKDPWWVYSMGLGRNASALLAAMWETVRHP